MSHPPGRQTNPPDTVDASTGGLLIGDWRFDVRGNELRRGTDVVRLELKASEVLACLAAQPGEVMSRDQLLDRAWHGVVVGDDAVTQVVIKLRRALGDDAQAPRYIETIPKRGYRLIAAVRPDPEPLGAPGPTPMPEPGLTSRPDAPPPDEPLDATPRAGEPGLPLARRRPAAAAAGLAALLLIGLAVVWVERSRVPPLAASAVRSPEQSYPLVAVLPLANLSADPARDYLSDGISSDLIDALGRFAGLRVLSWQAVQSFRAQPPQAAAVREQLAARYVVSGSVRESGGTLRVSVELADASSGEQLWSEHFGARDAELFNVIDSVVAGIVGRLAVSLADIEQQRAATRPPHSAEAYDLVLRARALMRLEQRVANLEARQLLVLAQQRAPGFAPVWVSAGDAEWQRAAYGWVEDPEASASRAAELARRALTLPDQRSHAQAYSLLSTVAAHQGHLDEALAHSSRALALNPSDGGTLFRHGHALLGLGRVDEAIAAYETLMRYEPRPTQAPRMQMGWAYYVAGRWEQALAYAESEIARSPDVASFHAIRAAALAQLGRLDEARLAANTARRLNPRLDAAQAGSRLRNPAHAALVREGLAKAGL